VIRVLIVAKSEAEAVELAELMAEDDRIEVVSADPDVVLAAGVPARSFDAPTVLLTGETPYAESYGNSVRAHLPPDAIASEVLAAVLAVGQGLVVLTWWSRASRRPRRAR
jgi:hypothetical protein